MTTGISTVPLSTALQRSPHTEGFFDGTISFPGYSLQFADVNIAMVAFREMVRNLAYDIGELAIVTYIVAKDQGLPITALPVFLSRRFDHQVTLLNASLDLKSPRDLEGRKVGVRYYGFTDGTWARGVLADACGVDLDKVTWVTTIEEHAEFPLPANVEFRPGADLGALLEAGELAAVLGDYRGPADAVRPIFDDLAAAEKEWYAETGIYPIHHLVSLKQSLLEEDPEFSVSLYEGFVAAKQPVLDRLKSGVELTEREQTLAASSLLLGGDPLPYGIEDNLLTLEAALRYARDQHLVTRSYEPDEIFAPTVRR